MIIIKITYHFKELLYSYEVVSVFCPDTIKLLAPTYLHLRMMLEETAIDSSVADCCSRLPFLKNLFGKLSDVLDTLRKSCSLKDITTPNQNLLLFHFQ